MAARREDCLAKLAGVRRRIGRLPRRLVRLNFVTSVISTERTKPILRICTGDIDRREGGKGSTSSWIRFGGVQQLNCMFNETAGFRRSRFLKGAVRA